MCVAGWRRYAGKHNGERVGGHGHPGVSAAGRRLRGTAGRLH